MAKISIEGHSGDPTGHTDGPAEAWDAREDGARFIVKDRSGRSMCSIVPDKVPMPKGKVSITMERSVRVEQNYSVGFSLFDRHIVSVDMRTYPHFSMNIRRGESDGKSKRQLNEEDG